MGSVKKIFKKATKVIKKPISKITKGIARGVAKVAKSVMKGVGKLNAKLGPIGMIAMSIAMPYAMGGLSNMIGRGAMSGIHGPTGWMGSKNVFLRSIGNVGNAIRTGYNGVTGAIGRFTKGITISITEGFSKMSGGKGNGLWSKISNGAKNLFTKARNTVKRFTPKLRAGQSGTVDVSNWGGHPLYGGGSQTMTSQQAAGLLKSGAIDASQLSNQTLGSAEGWFTKAGSSNADKLVTETLNSTFDSTIGSSLDTNGSRWINDLYTNGTGNSITNLEVADFAGSAIVTEAEGLASSDDDTSLPTTAAVKDYVDNNAGTGNAFTKIKVAGQTDVEASVADELTFAGSGINITTNASTDTITFTAAGGSGITIKDGTSGTTLTNLATTLNFTGAGVTATGSGSEKTITIPGGGGGGGGITAADAIIRSFLFG